MEEKKPKPNIKEIDQLTKIRRGEQGFAIEKLDGVSLTTEQESFFQNSYSRLFSDSFDEITSILIELDSFEANESAVVPKQLMFRVIEICQTSSPAPDQGLSFLSRAFSFTVPHGYCLEICQNGLLDLAQSYFPSLFSIKIFANAACQYPEISLDIFSHGILEQIPPLFSSPTSAISAVQLLSCLSYWEEPFDNDVYERQIIEAACHIQRNVFSLDSTIFEVPADLRKFQKKSVTVFLLLLEHSNSFAHLFVSENWLIKLFDLSNEIESRHFHLDVLAICQALLEKVQFFPYLCSSNVCLFDFTDACLSSQFLEVRAKSLELLADLLVFSQNHPEFSHLVFQENSNRNQNENGSISENKENEIEFEKKLGSIFMLRQYYQMAAQMALENPMAVRRSAACFLAALMQNVSISDLFEIISQGGLDAVVVNAETLDLENFQNERSARILLEGLYAIPKDLTNPRVRRACEYMCDNEAFKSWLIECRESENEYIADPATLIIGFLNEFEVDRYSDGNSPTEQEEWFI